LTDSTENQNFDVIDMDEHSPNVLKQAKRKQSAQSADPMELLVSVLKVYISTLSYEELSKVCYSFVNEWKTKIDLKAKQQSRRTKQDRQQERKKEPSMDRSKACVKEQSKDHIRTYEQSKQLVPQDRRAMV